VDTHSQSIRTDPEIYLPGEIDEDAGASDVDDSNEDEYGENDGVYSGMKRKSTTRSGNAFHFKAAKRMAQATASTSALNVIDDRRPDLTLIDAPVGETVPSHPYGRHSCLYIEVKVDANKKPNPQGVVCLLLLGVPQY